LLLEARVIAPPSYISHLYQLWYFLYLANPSMSPAPS
jgi:hypothetical protein